MFDKRITIFMGHYGSGKTFNAVSYALALKKTNKQVSIYDLDIVNPYFRTVDALNMLEKEGVELVVSPFAETNVDIPAMNAKSYQMVDDLSRYAVVDIGGDDRGALALGRFREKILAENNYDVLMVVNKFRPETRTIADLIEMKNEIEASAKIKFTGIVNNANVGCETTPEDIISGYEFCKAFSKVTGIPIKFTSVIKGTNLENININEILEIDPIKYGDFL